MNKIIFKEFHGKITLCYGDDELAKAGGSTSFYELCNKFAKKHNISLECAMNSIFYHLMENLETEGICHW